MKQMLQENPPLDLKEFEKLGTIDETDVSKFIKIINKSTCKKFCAQIFDKKIDNLDDLKKEIQTVMPLNHPSIKKILGYSLRDFKDKYRLALITKNKGEPLKDVLHFKHKTCSLNDMQKFINIFGIASGMSYLHRHGIVHTKLNLENIVETRGYYPKITNYGFLKFRQNDNIGQTRIIDSGDFFTAPEIAEQGYYDSSCDVFSFGMILCSLFSKLETRNYITFRIQLENSPERIFDSKKVPDCYIKLIKACLSLDSGKRPTFDEIVHELKNNKEFVEMMSINEMELKEIFDYIKLIEDGESGLNKDEDDEDADYDDSCDFNDDDDDLEEEDEDDYENFDGTRSKSKKKSVPIVVDSEKVDLINFEKRERIGGGGFGDVYKINDKKTGFFYAAKVSKKIISENERDSFFGVNLKHEVSIQSKMKHPSIVKFIGFSSIDFSNQLKPTIVTEYFKNGSLEKLLKFERSGYSKHFQNFWDDTMRLINIYGIASSMLFLHSHNIIHRDLKPENVIIDVFLFPKLSDFGLSIELNKTEFIDTKTIGTRVFISPEIYKHNKYSKSSDVYSFGLLVYEIMNKKYPFEDFKEVNDQCQFAYSLCSKSNFRPKFNKNIPKRYKELIESCWSDNPEERPTFEKIVNDLRNDSKFITNDIDKNKFNEYIQFIESKKGNKKLIDSNFPFHMIDLLSIYKEIQEALIEESSSSSSFSILSDYELQSDEYQTTMTSSVFKIKNKMNGKAFSAKIANFNVDQYSKEDLINIKNEIKKLTQLKHPSIQQFIDYSFVDFEKQPRPVVISEYCSSRTLYDIIQEERKGKINPLYWNDTKKLINVYGIASAMSYLHSNDILHPNLSLNNIFIDDFFYPKLTDFGFFTQIENNKIATNVTTNEIGLNAYLYSPEFLLAGKRDKAGDVYSYAYIVYEIITNEVPFNDIKTMKQLYDKIVVKHHRPPFNVKVQSVYKKLISSCWLDEYQDRPTFEDITLFLEKNVQSLNDVDEKVFSDYLQNIKKSTALK